MRKFCKLPQRYVSAFTLAEMMVVMLIMSIILAAMAPVMTTRSKADSSSPWRYSPENLSDAYFGAGDSQIAMIGQPNKLETDDAARLILTTSSSLPVHLSFKRDNTTLGRLQFMDTNLVLGNSSLDHLNGGSNNISIGPNNLTQVTSGGSNIAIGDSALLSTTSGSSNIGIGTTLSGNVDGNNNVAVGDDALTKANSTWNVAVGKNAYQLGTGGSNTIIGGDAMSEGSGQNNVAVGTNALWYGNGDGNVAIGGNSVSSNEASIALGSSSKASGETSIAIGNDSESTASYDAISIGRSSHALANGCIAIGDRSSAGGSYNKGSQSIAIGSLATANGTRGIAIGRYANANGTDNIAIGDNACEYVTGSNKVCIGQNAGPKSSDSWASDTEERIFIGSKSKFNDGNAVLEVHNKSGYEGRIYDAKYLPGSVVVVNGALLVKGGIITSMPWADDGHFSGDGGLNMIGRTGGQLEPINTEGGTSEVDFQEIFSTKARGQFRSPNNYTNKNVYSGWSDRRLKYMGKESTSGLDKIKQLKVFNYTFKKDKTKTPHVGVIAQDLQKVFPDAVKKGTDGFLSIRFEDMFYAMINAIKELDLKYQAQEKRINELEARIERLEDKISY